MRDTNKRKSSSKNNDVLDLTNDDNTVAESAAKSARTGDVKAEDDLAASALAGLAASNKRPAPPVFPIPSSIPSIQDSNPQASDTVSTPKKKRPIKSVSSSNVSKASKPVPAVQQTVVPQSIIEQAQPASSSAVASTSQYPAVASTSANPVLPPQQPVPQPTREQLGNKLLIAAKKGDVNSIKVLLDKDPTLLNCTDILGVTALHYASDKGHLNVVKELLSRDKENALLNAANNEGVTALYNASQNGHLEVVTELLDKNKALLNAVNKNGVTALHGASSNGHLEVVKELLSRNPASLTGVGKLNGQEYNAFDIAVKHCRDANKKAAVLKFLFDKNLEFFAASAAKLDVEYRKQIGIILPNEQAQPVVIPAQPVVSVPAPVQNVSLVDRTNALRDAVVNAAQIEFSMNVDLQRAVNAGGISATLSGVQKFLAETSIIYLPKVVDFAAKGSLTDKVENTEIVFKAMMNEINRNITDPALSGYLSRI